MDFWVQLSRVEHYSRYAILGPNRLGGARTLHSPQGRGERRSSYTSPSDHNKLPGGSADATQTPKSGGAPKQLHKPTTTASWVERERYTIPRVGGSA